MTQPVSIHRYELVSRRQLNARAERSRFSGCLIRLGSDNYGYGCIHPWPELGDLDLESILQRWQQGNITPLAARALDCAAADQGARVAGVSLFDGLTVPRSHATVALDGDAFDQAVQSGFDAVKVKLGRDLNSEINQVHALMAKYPELRWRLDFNHTTSAADVEAWLGRLGDGFCQRTDLMEDAWCEGEEVEASLAEVPLAVDRHVGQGDDRCPFWIIKPAANDTNVLMPQASAAGKKVVFTSYMDHPLGQSYAAWQAAHYATAFPDSVQTCGLITHGLFEPNAFTEALGEVSPTFHPAEGCGLGFDDLLEKLEWKPLI